MDNSTPKTAFQWDADNLGILREMKKAGCSASHIAKVLETTKGSVLGKLRRLGLFTPKPAVSRKGKAYVARKRKVLAKNGNPHLPPLVRSLLDLQPGECRWPVTDRPPHMFCARLTWGTSSYCCQHTAKAWRRDI
jgi:hypothetical protein